MTAGAEDPDETAHGNIHADRDVFFARGNINFYLPGAGPTLATTAYLSLVREFAPRDLLGRRTELAELAEFCASPGPGGYLWWRADAWAGKTALLAWFVLHPPDGVRVVSFFVTARYPGQDTWEAFTEVVIEQLAGLLGKPVPSSGNAALRVPHLRSLLDEAADVCRARGWSLVLVVDGLDEDREAAQHSIAALLPSQPPSGLRIVVSSRPHPPVPSDVPTRHPLRDQGIVRELSASPDAQQVQYEAEAEMDRLLRGTGIGRDVVGFVVAAGGGLASLDLATLTKRTESEMKEFFRAVSGRTFSCVRSLGWAEPEEAPAVYLLGHAELQRAAAGRLGADEVARYRDEIHAWARRYQDGHWPADTPEYLLRGYFSMLKSTSDIPRIVTCALDLVRHARMAELVGSDSPALAEIESARDAVHAQPGPDLRSMALLTVHRDLLRHRGRQIPVSLPAAWAAAGFPVRADHMVNSIVDESGQVRALCELVAALARHDRHDLASAGVARLVVRVAVALRENPWIERQLNDVAGMLTKAGFGTEAEAIARMLPTDHFSLRALGAVFRQHALTGHDRARSLADEIASRVTTLGASRAPDPETSFHAEVPFFHQWAVCQTLACLSAALADTQFTDQAAAVRECHARAGGQPAMRRLPASAGWNLEPGTYYELNRRLGGELEGWIRNALGARGDSAAIDAALLERCLAARTAAHAGNADLARTIASEIDDLVWRARCLAETAWATAEAGSPLAARDLALAAWTTARDVTNGDIVMFMLATAADALAAAGQASHVQAVARRARQVRSYPQDATARASWGQNMVRVLAAAGEFGTAWKCLAPADREGNGLVMADLAEALADHGEFDWALEAASYLDGTQEQSTLSRMAQAAARHGHLDIARQLLGRLTDPQPMAEALAALACGYLETGERQTAEGLIDTAETAASRVSPDDWGAARPWTHLARAWMKAGDRGRATQAAHIAESVARGCVYREQRASLTVDTAEALAVAGYPDEAEHLARSIGLASYQARALAALARYVPRERAALLVADALYIGGWQNCAGALAALAPDALADVAEECYAMLV